MENLRFWSEIMGLKDKKLVQELADNSMQLTVKRGEILTEQDAVVEDIPFLIEGAAKSYWECENGKRRTFCFGCTCGEPLTMIRGVFKNTVSFGSIEMLKDSTILMISTVKLYDLIQKNLELSLLYGHMMEISFQRSIERELISESKSAEERYCWFLKQYPEMEGLMFQKDIASFLNMSPENLSRIRSEKAK